ncbi:MAG TPA: hypothetical protein VEV37_02530 [Bryobacteraceae bacterium]|nr:hypothetical protein [Bryobacteraceae bacterium]
MRPFVLSLSLFLAMFTIQPALGFEYPLSPEAIREAYFLGKKNPEARQAFLKPYQHNLPLPENGPHVGLIEVQTPFTFIAQKVAAAGSGYHAQDAEQEFLGKPGPFRIHVQIDFTATFPEAYDTAASLGKFWEDFHVHLRQKREISAQRVAGQPIHSDAARFSTLSGYAGATIDVDYDVNKIDASGPATIVVDTPEGEPVETTFDFAQLR